MLRDFTPRLYQETIFAAASKKNTLVVLPTGLGKTAIAAMLTHQRLTNYPKSKVIFLAPTKPLAEQHIETFRRHLNLEETNYVLFTGAVSPAKRIDLWDTAKVIIGTPQGIENDILGEKINIEDVSLLIIDEAHHATGDYSYCFIAKQYMKKAKFPRILALTASPGSDMTKIEEVCKNLFIESVEVRTFTDPDVSAYIKEIKTDWMEIDLPKEFKNIQKLLSECYRSKLEEVKRFGYLNTTQLTKRELIALQAQLHSQLAQGNNGLALLRSISLLAEAMKVSHALELAETQCIPALIKYMEKMEAEARGGKSKAAKNLVTDINFKSTFIKARKLDEEKVTHPKFQVLTDIVAQETQEPTAKIIIFTQYRDSASQIIKTLEQIQTAKAKIFVGQTKKGETGMSQKEQKAILDAFRNEEFNTLVCTSVGEEGLDIPAVDLVIFYEPIPSAIRHIQRRGRTGRQKVGRVLVLIAKETRDTVYRWIAQNKEKQMYRTLEHIKEKFVPVEQQPNLRSYIPDEQKVQIVADYREKGSEVMKELVDIGISLRLEKLSTADFLCSADVGIEMKTIEDFVNSIIDGRLLEQLRNLKQNFSKPIVILQGNQDIYSVRKIHPNAIRGMFATIAVSFRTPIIQTKNAKETAALLAIIARREQDTTRDISLHSKKPLTLAEQQEYLVSALPSIGLKAAQNLLLHFKSIEKMVNATIEELKQVEGIGDILAQRISDVIRKEYKKD